MLDRLEKETGYKDELCTSAQFEKIVNAYDKSISKSIISQVYQHWEFRRNQYNKPINGRYDKPPAFNDPNPHVAFRPREKQTQRQKKSGRNDQGAFLKLKQLRQEFERARMLLEMIKKREKLKREYVSVITSIAKLEAILQKKKMDGGYNKQNRVTSIKKQKEKRDEIVKEANDSDPESEVSDGEEELTSPDYEEQNGDKAQDDDVEEVDVVDKENTVTEYDAYSFVRLPGLSEFRGRARVGRGGRVIFDRIYSTDDDPSSDFIPNDRHRKQNHNTHVNNHINSNGNHVSIDHGEESLMDETYDPDLS